MCGVIRRRRFVDAEMNSSFSSFFFSLSLSSLGLNQHSNETSDQICRLKVELIKDRALDLMCTTFMNI